MYEYFKTMTFKILPIYKCRSVYYIMGVIVNNRFLYYFHTLVVQLPNVVPFCIFPSISRNYSRSFLKFSFILLALQNRCSISMWAPTVCKVSREPLEGFWWNYQCNVILWHFSKNQIVNILSIEKVKLFWFGPYKGQYYFIWVKRNCL